MKPQDAMCQSWCLIPCVNERLSALPIRKTLSRWRPTAPPISLQPIIQVKAGGDAAALKGIIKALLELDGEIGELLDRDFIAEHTQDFDILAADMATTSLGKY